MVRFRRDEVKTDHAPALIVGGIVIGSWLGWLACAAWALNPGAGTVALVGFVLFVIYRESKRPRL